MSHAASTYGVMYVTETRKTDVCTIGHGRYKMHFITLGEFISLSGIYSTCSKLDSMAMKKTTRLHPLIKGHYQSVLWHFGAQFQFCVGAKVR
jgi:hypothetical protein